MFTQTDFQGWESIDWKFFNVKLISNGAQVSERAEK